MAYFNEIIHQSQRFRIMAALNTLPAGIGLEFVRLKRLTSMTDGNLSAHIESLAKAGYVDVEKAFAGKRPQTTVKPTKTGKAAFAEHIESLNEIVGQSRG